MSRARSSPSSVPSSASLASHTSSVLAMSGLNLPPACFSNELRWRSTFSISLHNTSSFGCKAINASSIKSRRTLGAAFTNSKSSGENTVVRTTPSKSRERASRCLFTSERLRPVRTNSVSMSTSLPSACTTVARNTALSQPVRMSASFGTPRKLFSVARYPSASTKLVLP